MGRNIYYLMLGLVLGAVLGLFVCDETKKRILKALHDKARWLSRCCKSSSEKAMHKVESSIKDFMS